MTLEESGIKLNNGNDILEKFERVAIETEESSIGIKSGVLDTPLITDESITNNSHFIANLFNNDDKPKTYSLK